MIDGIGSRWMAPGPAAIPKEPARVAGRDKPLPSPAAGATLTRIAHALSASPPVDTARVARLQQAIAAGTYTADPQAIAARMIALETPFTS